MSNVEKNKDDQITRTEEACGGFELADLMLTSASTLASAIAAKDGMGDKGIALGLAIVVSSG